MIKVQLTHSHLGYIGINCSGHAMFADEGKDIICAAVSTLVVNTINGIEQFTEDAFKADTKQGDDAFIDFKLTEEPSKEAILLMNVMVMGLEQIQQEYGNSYLTLQIQEV